MSKAGKIREASVPVFFFFLGYISVVLQILVYSLQTICPLSPLPSKWRAAWDPVTKQLLGSLIQVNSP